MRIAIRFDGNILVSSIDGHACCSGVGHCDGTGWINFKNNLYRLARHQTYGEDHSQAQ